MVKPTHTEEHIREAAYLLWKNEGEPAGQDQEYWFRAEAELSTPKPRKRAAAKKAADEAKPVRAAKPAAAKKPAAKKPAARKAAPKAKAAE